MNCVIFVLTTGFCEHVSYQKCLAGMLSFGPQPIAGISSIAPLLLIPAESQIPFQQTQINAVNDRSGRKGRWNLIAPPPPPPRSSVSQTWLRTSGLKPRYQGLSLLCALIFLGACLQTCEILKAWNTLPWAGYWMGSVDPGSPSSRDRDHIIINTLKCSLTNSLKKALSSPSPNELLRRCLLIGWQSKCKTARAGRVDYPAG